MDSDNLLIVCRSCGRKVLMHNMRPDGTGENMVCVDCYKRNSPSKTMSISEAAAEQSPKLARKTVERTEPMIKYLCTGCKYKFSRKKSQEVGKCPYCGRTNIVMDNQLGADKLLKESNDKRFETW
jgi:DNA-directed RNA polymerase subunit RPC12/RpoP